MRHLVLILLPFVVLSCRQPAGELPRASAAESEPRPLEHLEIVSLGDSLARGTGDEEGGGLTGRLEAALQQRGIRSVETVNLGVNGARTADVLARLRDPDVRRAIAKADAVVLSIGANDLAESARGGDVSLRELLDAADIILDNIATIVDTIHALNPRCRILILGAYNPVPNRPEGRLVAQYLDVWDTAVTRRFRDDVLVEVVKMSDVVVPARLSRLDHFHPGGEAYEEAARRIAGMLLEPV